MDADETLIADLVHGLDSAQRDAVMAIYRDMMANYDESSRKTTSAETNQTDPMSVVKTNAEKAAGPLAQFLGSMSDEVKSYFAVTANDYLCSLKTRDAAKLMNASIRLIMCANYNNQRKLCLGVGSHFICVPRVSASGPFVCPKQVPSRAGRPYSLRATWCY
jgi:hypothetical protein